tara:strand:+ start:1167 stop:1571 length:405 start_codon:yes stop_codon:yes gene_type:complete
MKPEIKNLCLFIGISFVIYLFFRFFNFSTIEGMTDASGNAVTPPQNGVAGNATSYGAIVKSATIKMQDTFLIPKYRTEYETIILNLEDLINNLMLKATLSIDTNNPGDGIKKLVEMNQAKVALNGVMKFIDGSK